MPENDKRADKRPKANLRILLSIPLVLVIIYFYPRLLVKLLGEANPWTSYLYQYGLGLIVFLIGIWMIISTKACQLGRGHDTFWFRVLLGGFVFFALVHAIWILAALKIPYLGS